MSETLAGKMTSDFALAMMKKMGWSEGKGLGKEEDGRTNVILTTQKDDSKGLGFGTEGAFKPWWDDLYNTTAVTVNVKKQKKKDSERGFEKKKKKKEQKKLKKEQKKFEKKLKRKEKKQKKVDKASSKKSKK